MAFLLNVGYKFSNPSIEEPDGMIILASKIAKHTLERRKFPETIHFENRYFDPQLYLATIDAHQCKDECVKLSSYSWFGSINVQKYESTKINQTTWKKNSETTIISSWIGNNIVDPVIIQQMVKECIDFQNSIGCAGIILPSPLTVDYNYDYSLELLWLDLGLEYIHTLNITKPVYATIAISDSCLRIQPKSNQLIQLLLDSLSARDIAGAYLVVEQGSERQDTKFIENIHTLEGALYITHMLSNIGKLDVVVNFFGPFGLALGAVGASGWASNWYKSLIRFRIADLPKPQISRAFPSYWSYPLAAEINLESELDNLVAHQFLDNVIDDTEASSSLIAGLKSGVPVAGIIDWRYSQSNVTSAIEHYILSAIHAEKKHRELDFDNRLDLVEQWLVNASELATKIKQIIPNPMKSKLDHVYAWRDAFVNFRRSQNL